MQAHLRLRTSSWAKHLAAAAALRACVPVLQHAAIDAVLVKGAVLAYSLYADPTDRPISDVDIRIRPRDAARVRAIARREGWPLVSSSNQTGAFELAMPHILVEFETSVGPPGVCALTVDTMIARSQPRTLPNGLNVREPELHDHAILLVATAFKDKLLDCPTWTIDDLVAMAELPTFDVRVLVERVREARVIGSTWIVADWLWRTRSSAAWQRIRDSLGERPPRPRYTEAYVRAITGNHGSVESALLARAASDRPTDWLYAYAMMAAGTAKHAARKALGRR